MLWRKAKELEPELTKDEIRQLRKVLKEKRDVFFEKAMKLIFSDQKITYRNNTYTSGIHFIIGNAFFYIDEVNVDGFTFNEEDSKILYETAKYKFLYGQEDKKENRND